MTGIVQHKLTPPVPPAGHLPRRLLPPGPPPRVVTAVAGPGYGKTYALEAVAAQAREAGHWTAWLAADALDLDAGTVFQHLVAAVQTVIPPFGLDLAPPATAGRPDFRAWWQQFFGAFAAYHPEPGLWLCLDDVHHWLETQPGLLEALKPFLERLPPGLHLALASRQRLPLGLAKLAARGEALALGPAELRFSPAEGGRLFEALGAGHEAGEAACARLDGWPLGLGLVAARGGAEGLRAYVAEEYLAELAPDLRAFLVEAAPLRPLTAEACTAVLGTERPGELLDRLEAAHLLQRWEDGTYRVPGFLEGVLEEAARRELAPAELRALHERAGAYFEAAGRPDAALAHRVAAASWPAALRTVRAWFPALHAEGRPGLMARWLAAFPSAEAGAPWLTYWRGQLAWQAGDHAQAGACYERALAGFTAEDDGAGRAKATLRLLTHALVQEDLPRFEALQAEIAGWIDQADDVDRADWALVRALAAEQRGDLAAWASSNRQVLALPVAGNVELATCAAFARLNLFNVARHQGAWPAAHEHLEAALQLAEAWRFGPTGRYAGFMRVHLWLAEGRLEAADAWLRALEPGWEEGLDWHDRACALTVVGAWHQLHGQAKEAERTLLRALAVFEQAGFPLGKKVPIEQLMWLAAQRGQADRLDHWLREAGPLDPRSYYDLALRLAHARGQDRAGRPGAPAAFAALVTDLEAAGAGFLLARTRLYQAASLLEAGDPAGARDAYARGTALIEAGGYGFLRQQDAALWAELAPLDAAPATGLRLRLFGGFEAWVDGVRVDRWPRRGAQALLALLALHPRGLTTFELGEMMSQPAEQVQNLASSLRRVLEPALPAGARSRFVRHEQDRYRLAADVPVASDVAAFQAAIATATRAQAAPAAVAAAYAEALDHYGGPLLDAAPFEAMVDAEREGLQAAALAGAAWLVAWHAGRAEEAEAARWCERAIAIGPSDEATAMLVMRHFGLRGYPERVRTAYWDYRKALKRQVGLAPSEALEAAYREALAASAPRRAS